MQGLFIGLGSFYTRNEVDFLFPWLRFFFKPTHNQKYIFVLLQRKISDQGTGNSLLSKRLKSKGLRNLKKVFSFFFLVWSKHLVCLHLHCLSHQHDCDQVSQFWALVFSTRVRLTTFFLMVKKNILLTKWPCCKRSWRKTQQKKKSSYGYFHLNHQRMSFFFHLLKAEFRSSRAHGTFMFSFFSSMVAKRVRFLPFCSTKINSNKTPNQS